MVLFEERYNIVYLVGVKLISKNKYKHNNKNNLII